MGASAVVRGRTRTRGSRISEARLQRVRAGAQEVPLVCQGMGRKCWTDPHPPPLGVESRVSPMWWSRGNSFDLLHSDPPNLGAKLNNRTAGPDVLGRLRLGMRAVVFTPVWRTWEVCLPEPTAGVLKERSEARKEACIPLKCTDNWIPMGCSRRGLLWRLGCGGPGCCGNTTTSKGSNRVVPAAAKMKVSAAIWRSSKRPQKVRVRSVWAPSRPDVDVVERPPLSRQRDRWAFARNHTRIKQIYEWGRLRNTSCTKSVQRFVAAARRVLWFDLSHKISPLSERRVRLGSAPPPPTV